MTTNNKCPLCGKPDSAYNDDPYLRCKCTRCGEFMLIISQIMGFVPTKEDREPKKWQIAAFVRERNLLGEPVPILFPAQRAIVGENPPPGSIGLDLIEDTIPKSVAEQLDRTLLHLYQMSGHLGVWVSLTQDDYPIAFGVNFDEFDFIMCQLAADGLIRIPTGGWPGKVQVTAKGYNRVAELERGLLVSNKQAFVAMWFKEEELGDAYKFGIEPAIRQCGYNAMKVNQAEHNEDINDFIIAEIRKSKFLVADFTGHRHGVYFEAGYMLGLGRKVIFTCRKDHMKEAHFDTSHRNHVIWETHEELCKKLCARIQATIVV